jgi:VanZ family protein
METSKAMNHNTNRSEPHYWLPPLLWMAFLFPLSNRLLSSPFFYRINEWIWEHLFPEAGRASSDLSYLIFRKALHLAAYALMAYLVFRFFRAGPGLRWKKSWAAGTVFICLAYAGADESLQTLRSSRHGSWEDFGIDAAGVVTALVLIYLKAQKKYEKII